MLWGQSGTACIRSGLIHKAVYLLSGPLWDRFADSRLKGHHIEQKLYCYGLVLQITCSGVSLTVTWSTMGAGDRCVPRRICCLLYTVGPPDPQMWNSNCASHFT